MGSQTKIGARNSSYAGARGQAQSTGLSGLNKDSLHALNKHNLKTSKRGPAGNKVMNKMDDIENALDLRASKGDLRPDYMPK